MLDRDLDQPAKALPTLEFLFCESRWKLRLTIMKTTETLFIQVCTSTHMYWAHSRYSIHIFLPWFLQKFLVNTKPMWSPNKIFFSFLSKYCAFWHVKLRQWVMVFRWIVLVVIAFLSYDPLTEYYSYSFPSQIQSWFHNVLLNWVEKGKDKENTNLHYQGV